MELVGTICEMTTAGRWGRPNRMDVFVRDCFEIPGGRSYLLVEDKVKGERFLLTARDDKDKINGLEPKRLMAIAIGREKEGVDVRAFTRSSEIKEYFFYQGVGLVQIVDEELIELRNRKESASGVMDQLQATFKRWMGM
jgi:hypothetical protein